MSVPQLRPIQLLMRALTDPIVILVVAIAALAAPARAQDTMTKESIATLKAAFSADLDNLKTKFVGLAQAFPQDKYTWRPMEGVRSVSEVLMLAAMEGYAFIPNSFGGKPADLGGQEAMATLRTLTDKTQIIDHLNKAFAHAKQQLDAVDPATLMAKRRVMGQEMGVSSIVLAIGGDLHEHLGQMIAYARMNHIVPPWSK
jgi:hypothetical protein